MVVVVVVVVVGGGGGGGGGGLGVHGGPLWPTAYLVRFVRFVSYHKDV